MSKIKSFTIVSGGIVFLLLAASCAHFQKKDPAAMLTERVSAHWKAKQDGDWETAYGFYCAAFRDKTSKVKYIKGANIDIKSFKIQDIKFSEDKRSAEVTLHYAINIKGYHFKNIPITELWKMEEKQWRLVRSAKSLKELFTK